MLQTLFLCYSLKPLGFCICCDDGFCFWQVFSWEKPKLTNNRMEWVWSKGQGFGIRDTECLQSQFCHLLAVRLYQIIYSSQAWFLTCNVSSTIPMLSRLWWESNKITECKASSRVLGAEWHSIDGIYYHVIEQVGWD